MAKYMKTSFLDISARDQLLITREHDLKKLGHSGGSTCSDSEACWLSFRFETGSCFVKPAELPDGNFSNLPSFVKITGTDPSHPEPPGRLPVLNPENKRRIYVGDFPRGPISEVQICFPDGEKVTLEKTNRPGRYREQIVLKVTHSDRLRVFARGLLKKFLHE